MKAEIKNNGNQKELKKYLKPRVQKIEERNGLLKVETKKPEKLGKIPGITEYKVKGEKFDGIGGEPIQDKALAKIENRKDAARAFLATLNGYTLHIVSCERYWDVQALKKYNSEIIEIKNEETAEVFDFERKVNYGEEDFDVSETELLKIYMEFLTH